MFQSKFLAINSNWFISHLLQYSNPMNYFIRDPPTASRNFPSRISFNFSLRKDREVGESIPELNKQIYKENQIRKCLNSKHTQKIEFKILISTQLANQGVKIINTPPPPLFRLHHHAPPL